ncbi:MFS transporter [Sinorhizobium meliloti]|nr:MFS transporter [Sinorhizobium meliloti]TWA95746.1 MFS transporter [Ensifer sp. SEMIA 134]TWB31341.1 MFS transporter [Ensifer sp. SEMIA 135]MDX0306280.1 MFS transporter [Sinorhizobium meliloti]MQV24360.1 MFS transporter [Sinorhizobium meliloti]
MTNPTFGVTIVKTAAAWGAVASMALCVAVLIASEFMPVSLLTPIARDLGMSEGQAGQAISISGLFAVLTSLFIAGFTRKIDRKFVLSSFSLMLIVSGLVVSFAPNYTALMVGRALLGVAIGGFWSMSTAVVMRLLPESAVPEGLALLNAGNAIAATISAPLGSFLGLHRLAGRVLLRGSAGAHCAPRVLIGGAITRAVLPRLVWAQKETNMKMRIAFADHVFTATLYDSPPARDLWSMLPLELEIDNYANNEKIAYLPRKLTEEGSGSFSNEAPGDLCYYAPWGNLAFFYAGYRYSAGLIRLGRLDGGVEPLLTRGKFPLRIERLS